MYKAGLVLAMLALGRLVSRSKAPKSPALASPRASLMPTLTPSAVRPQATATPSAALPSTEPLVSQGLTAAMLVKAETGGAVAAAKLEVSAGALASDILINISQPEDQTAASATLVYRLGSPGLSLSKLAALTVPYKDLPSGEPQMQVWVSTASSSMRRVRAEETNWERGTLMLRCSTSQSAPSSSSRASRALMLRWRRSS